MYAPLLTLTSTEGLVMRFKIKINYTDWRPAMWWAYEGAVCEEAQAAVYTLEQVYAKTAPFWFNSDRDAGCECWLSLKLVP